MKERGSSEESLPIDQLPELGPFLVETVAEGWVAQSELKAILDEIDLTPSWRQELFEYLIHHEVEVRDETGESISLSDRTRSGSREV